MLGPRIHVLYGARIPVWKGAFVDTLVQTCRQSACSVYSTSFAAAMRPVAASTAETCCYCYQLVFVNIIYQYCNIIRVSCSLKKLQSSLEADGESGWTVKSGATSISGLKTASKGDAMIWGGMQTVPNPRRSDSESTVTDGDASRWWNA